MTTPAPSLQKLPPQKGTILVLHSIGEEYDGKLVEYIKSADEQGKIFVSFLEDSNSSMRVKIKCCRRPDIQPLELRSMLASLAHEIYLSVKNAKDYESADQDTVRIKSILSKDPCCIYAHDAMGLVATRKDKKNLMLPSSEEANREAIKHHRRGVANFYAYQDLAFEEYLEERERHLSSLLVMCGKFESASRSRKVAERENKMELAIGDEVTDKIQKASILLGKATQTEGNIRKKLALYSEAASCFFQALKLVVANLDTKEYVADSTNKFAGPYIVLGVTTVLNEVFWDLDQCEGGQDEKLAIYETCNSICTGFLKACTATDGSVLFIPQDDVDHWMEHDMWLRIQRMNSNANAEMEAFQNEILREA